MGTLASGILMKLFAMGLDYFLKKRSQTIQGKKDYIAFNEIMARKGMQTVQMRLRSNDQKSRITEMWKEENKS